MKTDKNTEKKIDAFDLKIMLSQGWTIKEKLSNGEYIIKLPKLIKGKAN